jgi:hypothetical protein
MPDRSRKRPRDPNQLGKLIVDLATGAAVEDKQSASEDAVARESGRRGGLRGGKARAARLSAERRSEIAREAATARWHPSAKD